MFEELTPIEMEIMDMEEYGPDTDDEFDEEAEIDEDEQSDAFMDSEEGD